MTTYKTRIVVSVSNILRVGDQIHSHEIILIESPIFIFLLLYNTYALNV